MAERGNTLLRNLDRVGGTALLRALSLVRRKRPLPDKPRRIGVLCVGAIGDLLLLSATLADLKAAFPDADIVLLCSHNNEVLLPLLPHENYRLLPVTRPDKALKVLRALDLDLLIDSTQWARLPAVLSALSGAASIGFRTDGQPRHFCYDRIVAHRGDRHEIENFRALVAEVAPVTDHRPNLVIPDAARDAVRALSLGPFAVLHAWPSGVMSQLKEWPAEHWAATAAKLAEKGRRVVLTGAPVDAENAARLAERLDDVVEVTNLTGRLKLPETAALLEAADCIVSVNTGIMHMAATFDVPLIALSGPTNPDRWGPLSDRATNIAPTTDGCGYLNLGFEYPEKPPDCMAAIPTAAVIAEIDRVLA